MVVILTTNEILRKGLKLVGFDWRSQQNVSRPINVRCFNVHYGSDPILYAQIWEDLQTTACPEACIDTEKSDANYFLMAIHFLKCYPTEQQQQKYAWYFASKVQALKGQKVSLLQTTLVMEMITVLTLALLFPAVQIIWSERWTPGNPCVDDDDNPVFIITVDGVHCRIHEPNTPLYPRTLNSIHTSLIKLVSTTSLDSWSSRIDLSG